MISGKRPGNGGKRLFLPKSMQSSIISDIISPFLFQHQMVLDKLPPAELSAVLDCSEQRIFEDGEVLYRQGQYPKGAFFLQSGIVSIAATSPHGQRQVIYFYAPGDWMGFRQLMTGTQLPIEGTAVGRVDALFIPAPAFEELLRTQRLFARNLLEALSFEFSVWVNRMTIFTKLPVRERLAVGLLILRDRFSRVEPPLQYLVCSRTDLADFIGASIETTVRALSSFRDSGWVKSRGKKITILDPEPLAEIANTVL